MRILVIAPCPGLSVVTEGMMQRVSEIDKFMRDGVTQARIDYLKPSLRSMPSRVKTPSHDTYEYTFNLFINLAEIRHFIKSYDVIYIHSVYNYRFIWPIIENSKNFVVADLHGIVPEEELFSGRKTSAVTLGLLEMMLIKRANLVVTVSESMVHHFANKYNLSCDIIKKFVTFPVFGEATYIKASDSEKENIAIYAGGLQPWQNVPLINQAIPKLSEAGYSTEFYYPNYAKDMMEEELINKIERRSSRIGSLNKMELVERYRVSRLGFLLRDDVAVNRVSFPTKLSEYLESFILPIVLQPYIGDFSRGGFEYLRYSDLLVGNIPDSKEVDEMAAENHKLYSVQRNMYNKSGYELIHRLNYLI